MNGAEWVGLMHGGVPCLRVGTGPPLVIVQGLTPEHAPPKGWERRMALSFASVFSGHFTVFCVNRKRELRTGDSMPQIAGHLAAAIEHDIERPVFVLGTSTGGSVALQLAADRPDLVRRLVVVCAAYRLGPQGRRLQADLAREVRAGAATLGWARYLTALLPAPLRVPANPVARGVARRTVPADPSDLLITLDAEDAFDLREDLPHISAPVLVVGGDRDVFYGRDLFEETAAGVPDGRAHIFRGWGHLRTGGSRATTNLCLGFMIAGLPTE